MQEPSSYYIARLPRLLKIFDGYAKHARFVLKRHFAEEQSKDLMKEAREEFALVVPRLPYIGGKQPLTEFIISTGMFLAVYRVTSAHGKSVEETGEMIYEIGRKVLAAYPRIMLRMFGGMNFSRSYLRKLAKRAEESHLKEYPEDYVFDFIEGDGRTFDYGVDYRECASCKFLAREGAAEIGPYLCPADILYSEALGWGLTRTMTLAEGAEKCDFRFKKGGRTNVAVPQALREVISRSE